MSAKLFFLPYQVATVNGIAQPGAQLFFYQTGTLTKLPIYTTDLLDVQLENPVPATGAGRFPDIYLDSTQTYRLVVKDRLGATLDDIDPFIPGEVVGLVRGNESSTANDRGELAAMIGGTGSNAMALLSEAGREGMFVWSMGDQSAFVTADPNQGIYVAPAADTTGASGAWVRKFSGSVNVKWLGATGDGTTDDSATFTAAIALLKTLAGNVSSNGFYKGSPKLFIPAGHYYLNTATLDLTHTVVIEGEGIGAPGGASTKLRWAAGATGIRGQRFNTSGASTVDVSTHFGGDGSVIRGLHLYGAYTNIASEGEYHGVHAKCRLTIEQCVIENWQGDGIYSHATAGAGDATEGNTNGSVIRDVYINQTRDAISLLGADANAWKLEGVINIAAARRWGINGQNFLSNNWDGIQLADCGIGPSITPTIVTQGGSRYGIIDGQEVGAATNAPKSATVTMTIASPGVVTWTAHGLSDGALVTFATTGALPTGLAIETSYYIVNSATNTFQVAATLGGAAINTSGSQSGVHTAGAAVDNTWWYYLQTGGVNTGFSILAFTPAMALRAGGAGRTTNVNAVNLFNNLYIEGGQAAFQAVYPTQFIAPQIGSATQIRGTGTILINEQGDLNSRTKIGSQNAAGTAYTKLVGDGTTHVQFGHSTLAPLVYSYQWNGGNLQFTYAASSTPANEPYEVTGPTTNRNVGTHKINFRVGFGLGDKKINTGTAAPVAGAYVQGDIVINSAPAAAGTIGWVCTTAGSPGTWKTFGTIAA